MINLTKTEYLELRNRGRENNDGYQFRSPNNPKKVIETISSKMPSDFFDARMYTINLLLQNREALKEIYPYSNYHYDKGNSLSKILR